MAIRAIRISATPAVGDTGTGDSTATATSAFPIAGVIRGVYLEYLDNPPAGTTDVTVASAGYGPLPVVPILTVADGATDGMRYPTGAALTTAGAAVTNGHVPIAIAGDYITVTIAQADDGDGVTVTVIYEE